MKQIGRNGWIPRKLNELGFVGRGKSRHRPRNEPMLYGGPYPFIQTADIMASVLHITKYSQTYSENGLAQSKLWNENTLCMTIAGENTAETAILSFKACFPDSVIGFIANPDKSNVYFVKYYLDTMKQQLKNVSKGATQDNLSLDKLLSFDILTPPLPTQHKIAAILSAYDDLIENNTRRITILEEMAQSLYREWFVHFRFPGHEKKRMVESKLGMIPEGWEVVKVGDISMLFRGRSYSSTDIATMDGLPFLNLKCIERDGGFRQDGIKRYQGLYKDTQTAQAGDIIMAVTDMTQERRLVARAARVPAIGETKFVFSMDLVKCVPHNEHYRNCLYGMFRFSSFPDEVKQYANGANVLHLSPEHIENYLFSLAPEALIAKYSEICSDMYKALDVLQAKNTNLRCTRDLLLPKLISGEIDVEGLELEIGEEISAVVASSEPVQVEEVVLASEQGTLWA